MDLFHSLRGESREFICVGGIHFRFFFCEELHLQMLAGKNLVCDFIDVHTMRCDMEWSKRKGPNFDFE